MRLRLAQASWLLLALVASAAWFVTSVRLGRIWGLRDAAPAIGLLVAVAVALTLWRWARSDLDQASLASRRCPRCAGALEVRHQHARPGGAPGVVEWACRGCGYDHSEALTCAACDA